MKPDDPRHGTNAGYIAHALTDRDYCQPCRDAHAEYRRQLWRKKYLRRTDSLSVPALGTLRRVQALLALGHTHAEIATAAAGAVNISKNVGRHKDAEVHIDTAAAIARAYDQLCMVTLAGWRRDECRRRAIELGYLPPLAWECIDDPDEQPDMRATTSRGIDDVAVLRVLAGDLVPTNKAERVEITRRWEAQGKSLLALERLTGWKSERYVTREAAA